MVGVYIAGMAGLLAVQRGAELWLAKRNRQWSLAQGAIEAGTEHYCLFFLLHGIWFAGWIAEGLLADRISVHWPLWLLLFTGAQGLRYWCIVSLGRQWNTRILVIPGSQAVRCGPYRYLNHPNYLAVAIEIFCVPMLFEAWLTAVLASLLNGGLLLFVRLPAEEKALRLLR